MAEKKETAKGVESRKREREGLVPWPREIERFFDRAFGGFGIWPEMRFRKRWPWAWRTEEWVPGVDVYRENDSLVVRADLPGIKQEDVEVEVEGEVLTIRGSRKEEKEIKEEDYYCAERSTGSFSRSVRLPEGTDVSAIDAAYSDGVLEVKIPQSTPPEKKTTKVKVR